MPVTNVSWQDIRSSSTDGELAMNLMRAVAPHEISKLSIYFADLKDTVFRDKSCSGLALGGDRIDYMGNELIAQGYAEKPDAAILINASHPKGSTAYLGIVLHELTHVINNSIQTPVSPKGEIKPVKGTLAQRRRTQARRDKYCDELKKVVTTLPKWFQHEWEFIRIVSHLIFRANELGLRVPFADVFFAGSFYGLSEDKYYYSTLIPELESSVDKSFKQIFQQRPPEQFCSLWRSDTGLSIN